MLKPLELTVYPAECHCYQAIDKCTGIMALHIPLECLLHGARATFQAKKKRLTSAELAAEYWRTDADEWQADEYGDANLSEEGSTWTDRHADTRRRAKTLLRFASLPHYDEEVTP